MLHFTMRNFFLSLGLLATSLTPFALGNKGKDCDVVFPIKLTWEKGAPDGFERDMIFMNGQFPGPALIIEEGDNVEVRRFQAAGRFLVLGG
jgi:hypothetical protein